MREKFSLYDVACACLVMLPFVAFSVLLALVIIPPVSADTIIIYPDTDETVYNGTEATTSVIRNAPGETNYPVGSDTLGDGIAAWSAASPNVDHLFRPIAIYNTSAIGGGSISSVVQSVFSESVTTGLGDPSFSITGGTPASYTSIAASDYNKFQNTEFITGTAYGSFPTWEYANFTFNAAGISYINKTGHTVLYYRNTWDTQNDYTGYTWASGGESYLSIGSKDHADSGRRPFLTIVFTTGDSTPPQSLSTFANTTNCSQTNISFTKPSDSDYDGFKVWWNNAAETNQTNTSTWYNKSGLTASTSYTLSTKTFDLAGNLNATFTNYTVATTACGDATPPDSITALTNTSVSCSALFYNWTNPVDTDYGNLMVWRNNTALANLTNTTTGVSWTGLPESTDITFSSKTCDLIGNCNATFVNMTKNTGACGVAPTAAFSASDTTVCTVDTVTFTDASVNSPTTWNWSFGDGNISALQNPTKIFNITGTYTINLTVNNTYGADSEVKTNYIVVSECAAPPTVSLDSDFTSNVTCGNVPFYVMFNDTSAGTGITTWNWSFGEGNYSDLEDDINLYSTPGLYTVRHSVADGLGNVSWENRTGAIRAVPDWITCAAATGTGGGGSGNGSEGIAILFGVVGGILGTIIIMRRERT